MKPFLFVSSHSLLTDVVSGCPDRCSSRRWLAAGCLYLLASFAAPAALAADFAVCTADVLRSPEMFNCLPGPDGVPDVASGPASTYNDPAARAAFPNAWDQFAYDQPHDPVFPGNAYTNGVFWAAPLTGIDMLRAWEAVPSFDNPESASARTGQFLGGVMGVSVANGIVYSQIGRREVNALDALTGERIWRAELVNYAGMGQSVVHEVAGRPMVFVPVGDQSYNIYNTVDFANDEEHNRGGSFGALYAFDGLTGEQLWRFDTEGSARPTPVYRDGVIYLATGGGQLHMLNAANGAQIGVFTNPGDGYAGLAAPNWYETADGRRYIIYGITRPALIIAVDVTDPANPSLGWQLAPPNAAANSPGDTSVAVDPALGLVVTTVFSMIGGQPHLIAYGIDANNGTIRWSQDLGAGDNPPGFKASVPMIKSGNVYVGNTINESLWSLVAADGSVRWSVDLSSPDPGVVRTRAAPAFYRTADGREVLIHAAGRNIRTFDAATGAILNEFKTLGAFSVFGAAQPAIVGNQLYLSAISGWVFAAPVDFVMSDPGFTGSPPPRFQAPPITAEYDASARPARNIVAASPKQFLYYAGGQDNNAFVNQGGTARSWQTPLRDALPLDAPPLDEHIYGPAIATQMTHWEFGAGSGLAVANGLVYASSSRYSIHALNAATGEELWMFRTLNRNFGQPLVTPNTVIVGGGDPHFDLGMTNSYKAQSPSTEVGAQLHHVTGLDPATGMERWTVWTGPGTSNQTPLYYGGNVYWVTGQGLVYAVNADTGAPVAPFMDSDGDPLLALPGFNAVSSPNLYLKGGNNKGRGAARALMIVGMAMPARMVAIDLETATVAWTQELGKDVFLNGFAATSVAVDQDSATVVGSVLTDVDLNAQTATLTAFALDARTGAVRWRQDIGTGAYPEGFVAATPVLSRRGTAFFANPIAAQVVSLEIASGALRWQTAVDVPPGRLSWGPGVVIGNDARRLIQPVGTDLYTFDADTGQIIGQRYVGGAFLYNNPVVAGKTLYIGNAWGWVTALPALE